MMRVCHKNTCPVGVAQNPELRKKFHGGPDAVVPMNYVAEEMRELMAQLGYRSVNEMVSKSTVLRRHAIDHWKARGLDYSKISTSRKLETM